MNKTITAYVPLKEGETITADCVWFDDWHNTHKISSKYIGEAFAKWHSTYFRSVEIPAPEPDPYAELKAAFAAGKTIQHNLGSTIDVWSTTLDPEWTDPPQRYRIKPEPVKVPLGPEDVPPGSVIRFKGPIWDYHRWSMVSHLETDGVFLRGETEFCSFEKLMQEEREISRDFGKTWEPCWKEGE